MIQAIIKRASRSFSHFPVRRALSELAKRSARYLVRNYPQEAAFAHDMIMMMATRATEERKEDDAQQERRSDDQL